MKDICDWSMEFCDAIKNDAPMWEIEDRWHDIFVMILEDFGFYEDNINFLWDNLVEGNWKRLHLTEDEEQLTSQEWLDKFCSEVFYCSDRWSFDRLMRCHWLYRAWQGEY